MLFCCGQNFDLNNNEIGNAISRSNCPRDQHTGLFINNYPGQPSADTGMRY